MRVLFYFLIFVSILGCEEEKSTTARTDGGGNTVPELMSLQSNDFFNDGPLLNRFAHDLASQCNGNNDFPHLSWANIPEGTKSFTLIVEDLTGQNSGGENFVHLNLYDIAPNQNQIATLTATDTGSFNEITFPDGTVGENSWLGQGGIPGGWGGPCPPSGEHTYSFTIFALNLDNLPNALNNSSVKHFKAQYSENILNLGTIDGVFGP